MLKTTTGMALLSATVLLGRATFAGETVARVPDPSASEPGAVTTFQLDGYLTNDSDPKRQRLYPSARSRARYYLIRRADVIGTPYQWTDAEKAAAGFVGSAPRYRVVLDDGAVVYDVTMRVLSPAELQLSAQAATDRESRLIETVSNLLKKFSDTSEGIVQNLK